MKELIWEAFFEYLEFSPFMFNVATEKGAK